MNAKQEFILAIQGNNLLCVLIRFGAYNLEKQLVLTTGYTKEEYNQFLNDMDFEYNSGYGGQQLYGTIWFCDGTWCSRGEYDGSEWWQYNICPDIPPELNRIDKVRESKLNKIL